MPATATGDARKIIIGETAPDFSLLDTAGTPHRLSELTKDSSCAVLFYRGHW
jgi:peroxiredoxin